jgi:hypothetical protein
MSGRVRARARSSARWSPVEQNADTAARRRAAEALRRETPSASVARRAHTLIQAPRRRTGRRPARPGADTRGRPAVAHDSAHTATSPARPRRDIDSITDGGHVARPTTLHASTCRPRCGEPCPGMRTPPRGDHGELDVSADARAASLGRRDRRPMTGAGCRAPPIAAVSPLGSRAAGKYDSDQAGRRGRLEPFGGQTELEPGSRFLGYRTCRATRRACGASRSPRRRSSSARPVQQVDDRRSTTLARRAKVSRRRSQGRHRGREVSSAPPAARTPAVGGPSDRTASERTDTTPSASNARRSTPAPGVSRTPDVAVASSS